MTGASSYPDSAWALSCPICQSNEVCTFERQEGLFIVSCENDDCEFSVETAGSSLKEAIERWNTRGAAQARSTSEEMVPKEFNDANIRVARRFMAERDHWYELVPRADRIQFPFIDPAEPASVPSTLRQCPICARRVASPCETLAIATSCPLSSTNHQTAKD